MKFHYRKHKIRFDRGRMWYSILNSVITALLVTIFTGEMPMYIKVMFAFMAILIIYIIGYVDDKLKLFEREQTEIFKRNPYMEKLTNDIEEIKQKLNN